MNTLRTTSTKETGAAAVLLALVSPILAFPSLLGPSRLWLVSVVAMAMLAGAVAVLRRTGLFAWCVGFFAVAVVAGWLRTSNQPVAINHFGGIALGVFAMATVAVWCQTRARLIFASVVFVVLGMLAVTVGFRSAPAIVKRKVLLMNIPAVPVPIVPLPFSGLHAHETANPNATSAAALMVLPVAAAIAMVPARWLSVWTALRLAGLASALWAATVVALMHSRSSWLSAVFVTWLWMRTWMGPRLWRIAGAVMFLLVPAALFVLLREHPRGAELVDSLVERINIWFDAAAAFRSSPWLGIGLDYFRDSGFSLVLTPPNQMVGTVHAHNIFLQTALDLGLVGLAAYLSVVAVVLRRALELARSTTANPWVRYLGVGAGLSVVSVHAYGMLDALSLGVKVGIFQWLSCGLVLAAWRLDRQGGSASVG